MSEKAVEKTNAMRMLNKAGIVYTVHTYTTTDGHIDGLSVAAKIERDPAMVYKTLVTKGGGHGYFVFILPVECELDLKAAARAVGEKAVSMIPVADIQKVTGYIRGGCSPVGMKKAYPTVIDAACLSLPTFIVSAGKIGCQVELSPKDLLAVTGASTADICV